MAGSASLRNTRSRNLLQVAMAGVDIALDARDHAVLQAPILNGTPPYCLTFNWDVAAQVFGYFKAVRVKEKTTSTFEKILFTSSGAAASRPTA
jgi:hypothetical protein